MKPQKQPKLYQATGFGPFIGGGIDDMLRYDGCSLVSETTDKDGWTNVVLSYPRGKIPTVDRWKSYKWGISPLHTPTPAAH